MKSKRKKFWRGDNRFRLMLTLELAVLLPAAALIYLNFHNIDSIKRNKTVDTHILRLRQKLEPNPEEPRFILTVHGIGYKFVG